MKARRAQFLTLLLFPAVLPNVLPAHQPHDPLLVVEASPNFANDNTLIAATDYLSVSIGVYLPIKSTDGGASWTVPFGLPNVPITAIRFSPSFSADKTVFIAGGVGFTSATTPGTRGLPFR